MRPLKYDHNKGMITWTAITLHSFLTSLDQAERRGARRRPGPDGLRPELRVGSLERRNLQTTPESFLRHAERIPEGLLLARDHGNQPTTKQAVKKSTTKKIINDSRSYLHIGILHQQ